MTFATHWTNAGPIVLPVIRELAGRRRYPSMSGRNTTDTSAIDAAYTRPGPAGEGVGWLRRLGPFIRRYRAAVIATLILSVVAQTLIGLLPLIQQIIVDHSILSRERPVGPMLILLLSTGFLGFTANYGRRYLGAKVSVGIQHDLRLAIHRHLYELDFSRHDELSVGDVMSRATADLTLIQVFFFSVPMLVANMTLLVVALVVMFVLSPLLSLVVVVFVPVFAGLAYRFRNRIFPSPAGTTSGCRARWPASSTKPSPACESSRPSPRRTASSPA